MNYLKKNAAWLWLCSMAVFLLVSCNRETDLKLNFRPGDKFLYSTQVNQKINGTMDQSMLMEMIYAYSGEEGGNKKLAITYDHIRINMSSPMGVSSYDSKDNRGDDEGTTFMNNIIGKSFSVSIAPNGDIVKVEGLSDMIHSLTGNADADTRAEMENQFSDTAIRLMMQNSFDLYPGKPVKKGESWSKKTVMSFSGVNVNVENTYSLTSVSGGTATVAVKSVMNLPRMVMAGQAGGPPMQIEMQGKQEGTMDVDIASGRIISGKTSQEINGKIIGETNQVVDGQEQVLPQEIPMNIKGDIAISSKKL